MAEQFEKHLHGVVIINSIKGEVYSILNVGLPANIHMYGLDEGVLVKGDREPKFSHEALLYVT